MGALLKAVSMAASCLRKGVIGSAAMVFPFGGALADATVFRDGAGVRLMLPLGLANLYAEDGAVQVLTAGAVHFTLQFAVGHVGCPWSGY